MSAEAEKAELLAALEGTLKVIEDCQPALAIAWVHGVRAEPKHAGNGEIIARAKALVERWRAKEAK